MWGGGEEAGGMGEDVVVVTGGNWLGKGKGYIRGGFGGQKDTRLCPYLVKFATLYLFMLP